MNWENRLHSPTYPVGNVHLSYYEDVVDRFEEKGFEPEDSHIVTVGSDLIGWWIKEEYPEAEVTTVESNPRTSYLQNFAGNYLSRPGTEKSTAELRELLGIEDASTGIPDFVDENGTIPLKVLDKHTEYVQNPSTNFEEVPDFSKIGFAWKDFYPEILDDIGFNTRRPDNHVIGDFRYEDIEDADLVLGNNVVDIVGKDEFYRAVDDITAQDAYVEAVSEPQSLEGEELVDERMSLEGELNPKVDFWWRPSPLEQKDEDGYRPTVVLYYPER